MTEIEARSLSKHFGAVTALDSVDLTVESGELCGVVGSDGAGKTTLLRCVVGLYRPDSGQVRPGWPGRARMGLSPQGFHLYEELTVDENLTFFGAVYGLGRSERVRRIEQLLGFTGLAGHRHRSAGQLSGGMRQKLTLACSIIHEPPILLLDEPTTGVDPLSRREFWELVEGLHTRGTTILLASSYFDEVERCERVVFLHEGRVLASGEPGELTAGYGSLEEAFVAAMS